MTNDHRQEGPLPECFLIRTDRLMTVLGLVGLDIDQAARLADVPPISLRAANAQQVSGLGSARSTSLSSSRTRSPHRNNSPVTRQRKRGAAAVSASTQWEESRTSSSKWQGRAVSLPNESGRPLGGVCANDQDSERQSCCQGPSRSLPA
jgi:hypothetical protein